MTLQCAAHREVKFFQGWEFAYSLIRSDRSRQMSNCEGIAQVAHVKRATVSESRSWQMSDREQFAQVAHDKYEQFAQKIWLKLYFWYVFCT